MSLNYEDVLKEFAQHVGLDTEALLHTEEVLIDGFPIGLQLEGSPASGDVLFFTTLGTPTPEHLDRIARTLLEANNFWVGTGGCTIGLQQETGAVTLCGRIAIDDALTGEVLAALLSGFVDTAAFWKAFVEGKPADGGAAAAPLMSPHMGLRA